MTITNLPTLPDQMYMAIEKFIAVYELLHSHARGQTDLTEDQLANVIDGVAREARDVLARASKRRGPGRPTATLHL